jgi:hypothetical protein
MKRIMVDLETFGNATNSPIVQIGAVEFDLDGNILTKLKILVDGEDAVRNGAVLGASAVYWWLQQSEGARNSVCAEGKEPELGALNALNEFMADANEIWSHATFDFVIIMEALRRRGIKPKFGYRAAMDIRTLVTLGPKCTNTQKREGVHHDALDDAIYQVGYCAPMIKAISDRVGVI